MAAQRLGRVEMPGEFSFGQGGVDFLVADVMQQDGRAAFAALEFGDQVMGRLRHVGRDRAQAKRADRGVAGIHERKEWTVRAQWQGQG